MSAFSNEICKNVCKLTPKHSIIPVNSLIDYTSIAKGRQIVV